MRGGNVSLRMWAFCVLCFITLQAVVEGKSISDLSVSGDGTVSKEEQVKQFGDFKCPFPFGVFADPNDCSRYYMCFAGRSMNRKCGFNFHFDIFRRTCLPAQIAICKNKGDQTTKDVATFQPTEGFTISEEEFICPSISGTFPHPTICWLFYTCYEFQPTLKTCLERELFDAIKLECKPEDEVHCGKRERHIRSTVDFSSTRNDGIHTDAITDDEDRVTTTDSEESYEDTTDNERITDYISTSFPTKVTPPETDCDEDDLDCIITETGDVSKWFKCPEAEGNHVHPSNQKLFIICLNWIPSAKKCGKDLVFSKELLSCVLIEPDVTE